MDPIWLSIAFVFGFGIRMIGLPPLVGYLIAGFILNLLGVESSDFVKTVSDLGVTLLLFTIGLKIKIKNLLKPEIWAGASIHMMLTTAVLGVGLFAFSMTSLSIFSGFDWKISFLVAFALSFSSTVFAVKALEEKGEMNSVHGIISIGVLIMQDIFAVLFIVFATDKTPEIWALAIPVILVVAKPLLMLIMTKIGHGELLILYGFFLALIVGAELFKFVGLKADLGALVVGMLVSNHKKAHEMAQSLLSFKDFFLIGFFLSIGLSGIPTAQTVLVAFIIALAVNFKVLLYFFVFTRFRLRARTAVFTTLTLANYSEFGLIVASIGAANGWIPSEWLITIAIALGFTFIVSSPLNTFAHAIYAAIHKPLHKFETKQRLIYDDTFDIGDAEILIFGMGKLGTATYDQLNKKYGQKVLGLDYDDDTIEFHRKKNRNVIQDDATDSEFWERIKKEKLQSGQVKLIMLCMDEFKSNKYTVERLKAINFNGMIAATARYDDEVKQLKNLGVDSAFNFFAEAGIGFADHVCEKVKEEQNI